MTNRPIPWLDLRGIILIRCLSLLLTITSLARSEPSCPKIKDIEFLQSLNQERQYSLVMFQAEILRRSVGCPMVPEIDLELGKALYQLGAFSRAREILKPHLRMPDPSYRRYWAESHLLDMSNPNVLDSLRAFADSPSSDTAMEKEERKVLLAAVYFLKSDTQAARLAWANQTGNANRFLGCPDLGEPRCYLEKGLLSPSLGAGLSLAPGLGYVYAGQIGDGIFAFTVVSFFYGVAAYYSHFGSPERAWTFAGFGAVFHASSLYGAYRTVERTNTKRKTGFLLALHRRLFP